jgi:hypothetical protein
LPEATKARLKSTTQRANPPGFFLAICRGSVIQSESEAKQTPHGWRGGLLVGKKAGALPLREMSLLGPKPTFAAVPKNVCSLG